ncbi:MAG: DNA repair protein RecN [Bryobacteraceae bacterium]
MLIELVIENYAVIERLRVRFHPGLNLLTGETGSGKSIVVDALGLLLGGRGSADMVRTGSDRARVWGLFAAPQTKEARALLDSAGLEPEDGDLLIEREIQAGGKSRAFVCSRPVTATLLRDLGRHLGDIHGQHDQQRLFEADAQLEILDGFAGAATLLEEVGEAWSLWRACRSELDELERNEQEKLRMADLWNFQRREIEEAGAKPGEDTELENERRRLQNVARIEEAAGGAYQALYDSPESALSSIRSASRRLEELARIDAALAGLAAGLKPAEYAVEEASFALRDYLARLEANPARLEEIETRLALLDKLKRKYGATLDQVLAYLGEVKRQMEAAENADQRRAALVKRLKELTGAYEAAAGRLSRLRRDSAPRLAKRVEEELAQLAMERTVFRVELAAAGWSERGIDQARFLVSPNVGEEPRPLDKVASGGEISRLALALKTCGSGKPPAKPCGPESAPRTLVFDEVDAGIGGRAAEVVGRRLKQVAAANQVLCVTHLPQIAGFADHHYYVEKKQVNARTTASIEKLDQDARVREIGRMLSGEKLTPEALKHARKLIELSS